MRIICVEEHVLDAGLAEAGRSTVQKNAPSFTEVGSRFRMKKYNLILLGCFVVAGCGSQSPTCKIEGFQFTVSAKDPTAAPDHSSTAPGNLEQFTAGIGSTYGPGCVSNQLERLTHAQWSTADPKNVTISSADDATNGLATCVGSTNTTVSGTLTANGFTETQSISLTCR